MSSAEKAYGAIKNIILMNERFDAIQAELRGLSTELADLARSHSDLGQRVSRIEGFIDGVAAASSARPQKLPKG